MACRATCVVVDAVGGEGKPPRGEGAEDEGLRDDGPYDGRPPPSGRADAAEPRREPDRGESSCCGAGCPSGSGASRSGSDAGEEEGAPTTPRARVLDTSCVVEMPVVEEDTCAICLDEFTEDDPGMETECGHVFHIQCLMQWRSRSDECPMCFQRVRLVDAAAQELLEEVEPNTVSLSRRTSSELAASVGPSPHLGAEEDIYSSSMELFLRMMNQHPSARATQSLERALQETIMLDDYRQQSSSSASASSASAARQPPRAQRRAASEDNAASDARRRRRDGGAGPPADRGRGRSASGSAGGGRLAAAEAAPAGRARSGSESSGPTLRSRWQAASSRARESLMRASQEIRTRIRGKQQQQQEEAAEAGGGAKARPRPPAGTDRAAEVVPEVAASG